MKYLPEPSIKSLDWNNRQPWLIESWEVQRNEEIFTHTNLPAEGTALPITFQKNKEAPFCVKACHQLFFRNMRAANNQRSFTLCRNVTAESQRQAHQSLPAEVTHHAYGGVGKTLQSAAASRQVSIRSDKDSKFVPIDFRTVNGKPFYRPQYNVDLQNVVEENGSYLMFYYEEDKALMEESTEWNIDGTFELVRSLQFRQLVVISTRLKAEKRSVAYPLFYILCKGQSEADYTHIIHMINNELGFNLKLNDVSVDFELGLTAALKKYNPRVIIQYCNTHCWRSWLKKFKTLGLTSMKKGIGF